jgi:hypothetical protein
MSTHCYVGTIDTNHLVRARYVHSDGSPCYIVPTLGQIWYRHAQQDTTVLIDAVLAHDWDWFDPDTTADTVPVFDGARPVPGVGMTLAAVRPDGTPAESEPVSVFPLTQAGHFDASWIYLIDPATATVTVHTADGEPVAQHNLADYGHTRDPHPGIPDSGPHRAGPEAAP